jgi:hypothetical protein
MQFPNLFLKNLGFRELVIFIIDKSFIKFHHIIQNMLFKKGESRKIFITRIIQKILRETLKHKIISEKFGITRVIKIFLDLPFLKTVF